MPAIDTQRGKKAPPRKKPLQIGKVVAKTQATYDAAQERKRSLAQEQQYKSQGKAVAKAKPLPGPATRQALSQEQQYKSQGRAVKLGASKHGRAGEARARKLRQTRLQSRRAENQYRSQARSVNLQAQLQGLVAQGQRKTAKEQASVRHIGPVPIGKHQPLTAPTGKYADLNRKTFSALGKTPGELADIALALNQGDKAKRQKAARKLKTSEMVRRSNEINPTAMKGLEELSRGLYATAGAARAAVKGQGLKGALKGAERGIKKQDKYTVSDVLGAAGWNPKSDIGKLAKGAISTGGDILGDPGTYVTAGMSSVARSAAKKAAMAAAKAEYKRVMASALARGESKSVSKALAKKYANKAGDSAYTRTIANATDKQKSRGAQVRFAGKVIGGRHQTRATAALGRGVKGAAKPVTQSKRFKSAALKTRQRLSAANAQIRPAGMSKEEWNLGREIKAERRATEEGHTKRAGQRAVAIRAATRPEEHEALFHAAEAGTKLGGPAPPVKLSRRTAIRGRKRIKQAVTENPDRLNLVNEQMDKDFAQMREALREEGVQVGHVGAKPPVHVPDVTTDLKAERKAVGQARSDVARAEREQLEQKMPGGKPGPLTPAQKTRAERQLQKAVDTKRAHLAEFQRITRQAKAATSDGAKKALANRAKLVQTRIRSSQDAIDHWVTTLTKRETPNRPMLQPSGKVARAAAPMRAAPSAAKGRLTEALKTLETAKGVRKSQLRARRAALKLKERRAKEPQGYRPRVMKEQVEKANEPIGIEDLLQPARPRGTGGAKKPKPSYSKSRDINTNQPLRVLEEGDTVEREYAAQFTKDPALIHQAYMTSMGRGHAQAQANNKLIREAGRPVEPGQPLNLAEGERVYKRNPIGQIDEIDPKSSEGRAELRAIERGDTDAGEHFVMNKALADFVNEGGSGIQNKGTKALADTWTNFWGGWRSLALKTPTYVMHNATGDMFNGLGAQDPFRLAKNWVRANRALNERARSERGYKWFDDEMARTGKGTTTKIRGEEVPYSAVLALAEAAGVIGHGRLSEAAEMAEKGKSKLDKPRGTSAWRQTVQRSEDMARLGTFIGMLEKGMPVSKAAKRVRDIHFDYGDLTKFEQNVRNYAMPFYTFSARNVPLQLKFLATRPGMALGVEHAREEGVKASGIDKDYLKKLDPYELKQFSIPMKWGGKTFTVSNALPITDLSALTPTGKNLKDPKTWLGGAAVGLGKRGFELLGPYKTVGELLTNHSLFYGGPIVEEGARMTEVHPYVAKMAEEIPGFADMFGIKRGGILDKETGEHHWAWDKRKESALRALLPGPFGATYRATQESQSPRGFNPAQEALSILTGVRAKPYDAAKQDAYGINNRLRDIRMEIGDIHQAGHNLSYQPTERLKKLEREKAELQKRLADIQGKRLKFYKGRPTGESKSGGGKIRLGGGSSGGKIPLGGGGGKKKIPIG